VDCGRDGRKCQHHAKKSCVACKVVIEFNKYGTTNTFFAFAIKQLHKACIAYPSQQYG
jgi:hypothetical protein